MNSNVKQQAIRVQAFRFKRFSRKGYALFGCVGRVVVIGVLSASTLTHAKADGVSVRYEVAQDSLSRTELKLDEVIVTGSRAPLTELESAKIVAVVTREEVHRAAAASVNDVLKLVPGVDVRQRGGFGVQTDISVRGGNFDQITILLNGVPISSPQTGHHSADFPLSPDDIERIEVLEGPAARVHGAAAYNGVVNVITRKDGGAMVDLSGGSYGFANASGRVALCDNSLSLGYTRSDGATPNSDFSSTRAFWQGGYAAKDFRMEGQGGYSYKPYGANTFYGAASTDQWESNERIMLAVKASLTPSAEGGGKVSKKGWGATAQSYWNRWFDHYQWHKDSPVGENFHRVDAVGGALNGWFASALSRTSVGVEVRYEGIRSTSLGEPQPDAPRKRYARTNYSAFLEHNVLLERWTISAGLLAMSSRPAYVGSATNRMSPGIDIAFRPTEHWKLTASWNMALRMPTFTDLYYSGANIEGNRNLKPERTSDIALGARFTCRGFIGDAQAFYSHKTDMIDWVTYEENAELRMQNAELGMQNDIFRSVNFRLENVGFETNLHFLPCEVYGDRFPLRAVRVKYSYINEDSHYDVRVIQSKYAMDYLRHKLVLAADARLWCSLDLSLSWRWQDRLNAPSYGLLDGKLSWNATHYIIYIEATNILDKRYYDYITIPQPGFQFRTGVKLRM